MSASPYLKAYAPFNWAPRGATHWEFTPADTGWHTVGCDGSGNETADSAEYAIDNDLSPISTDAALVISANGLYLWTGSPSANVQFQARLYDFTNSLQVALCPYAGMPGNWAFQTPSQGAYGWPAGKARLRFQVATSAAAVALSAKIRLLTFNLAAQR